MLLLRYLKKLTKGGFLMEFLDLFENFNINGQLLLSEKTIYFKDIPWSKHPTFEGVELKHLLTSKETSGEFSYHLVKIAPNKKIGNHIHKTQVETHEVIAGSGICINSGKEFTYKSGSVSIFPMKVPHEITADENGLYIFAKFIPPLL